jgi:hypothetical protein
LDSYDEVAYMCAEAAGIPSDKVTIEHYDGDALGKAKFPFRLTDFYVAPDTVKAKLGYGGAKHDLPGDLGAYFESYKARDGLTRDVDFSKDQAIAEALKAN